jgi:hypothetical protein
MRLSYNRVSIVLLVSTLACRSVSEPGGIAADFVLDNINGRPLPTFVSPVPETPSIISATLHFDRSGKVVSSELQRDMTQGVVRVTYTLDYKISGNTVVIGCLDPASASALCAVGFSGTISSDGLSLTLSPGQSVVYNYKIAPTL